MALYEITQDCRIANKEYKKWEVVSDIEVGWFYPTVMKATKSEPKKEVKEDVKAELTKEDKDAEIEEDKKPAKKRKKK